MKLSFEYKGRKVTYQLMYKKTSAITINISEDETVKVVAPIGTSVQTVMDKVKGNAPWIISELSKLENEKRKNSIPDQYTYLGKNYGIEINLNQTLPEVEVKLARGKFLIQTPVNNPKKIREAVLKWYKDKVIIKAKERLKLYAEHFKSIPQELVVEEDDNILCEARDGSIFLNCSAGMLPIEILDYLLVISLCSLENPDSGQQEYDEKLKGILADHEKSKAWLEKNKSYLLI